MRALQARAKHRAQQRRKQGSFASAFFACDHSRKAQLAFSIRFWQISY